MGHSSWIAIAVGLLLAGSPLASAVAEEDLFDRPAMGSSSDPDDHLAESEDPDDLEASSEDPDDRVVETGNLDDHLVEAENPDDLREESDDPDAHVGRSTDLQDLPSAASVDAAAQGEAMEEARRDMGPELDLESASLAEVKHALALAKLRATEAEHAYSVMRDRNYPRGEARRVIIDERKIAHDRVADLERRYQELLND